MFDESIHIQEGADERSVCGLNLRLGTFIPHLYTHYYHPSRNRYAVHRVLALDENYPVYEQVEVADNPNFCSDCLSVLGIRALRDIA